MGENFFDIIKRVGIFIICAQAIIQFRPNASYDKYLRVLVSIIVLVLIVVPVFQMLGDADDFFVSMNEYEEMLSGRVETVDSVFVPLQDVSGQEVAETTSKEIEPVVIDAVEVAK